MRLRNTTLALSTVVAIGVAGCGSGPDSGTGPEPITVGVISALSAVSSTTFVNPYSVQGVRAAVKAVNAAGGVYGRPLALKVCDNAGDPNRNATCARQAVAEKWVAVVGGYDTTGPDRVLPILEAGTIPYVGQMQGTPAEFQSRMSFPVEVGTVGNSVGTAAMMVEAGCRASVVVSYTSSPGATERLAQITRALTRAGDSSARVVGMQPNTANITPIVADALTGSPDCVYFSGTGEDAAKLFTAVTKTGAGRRISMFAPTGVLRPDILAAMGPAAEGIRGSSGVPLPNNPHPSVRQYLDDLKASDPEARPTEQTLNGYAAVKLLALALDGLPETTGTALYQRLNTATSMQVMAFPTLDFTRTRDSRLYPRQPNTVVWYSLVKDGHWQSARADAAPTDISTYLP
ncbi:ABC transporter substrate-binding protein [Micromonospora marina]|uniref:ABC transporter substrate-binding protein n=1 Tax=Micromonospora marina TaxID=307120 RepID=UPI003456E295